MESADKITALLIARPLFFACGLSIFVGLLASVREPWSQFSKRFILTARRLIMLSIPVVTLGFICGYLIGASREAAIGSLITSALTLLGGVSIFIFQGKAPNLSRWVGLTVFCFSCSILYGVEHGAFDREFRQTDRFNKLSEQEYRIRVYRRNLGLPEEPPSWITGMPEKK